MKHTLREWIKSATFIVWAIAVIAIGTYVGQIAWTATIRSAWFETQIEGPFCPCDEDGVLLPLTEKEFERAKQEVQKNIDAI